METMTGPILKFHVEEASGYYEPGLDLAYIAKAGRELAAFLRQGKTAEIAYQPGDGTFYGLVFVPLAGVETASPRVVDGHAWDVHAARGVLRRDPEREGRYLYQPNAFLVAWLDHSTYPLKLGNRGYDIAASYVGEHFKTSAVSAASLALLFRAIAWYIDRPAG